jgi:hypothetical protein
MDIPFPTCFVSTLVVGHGVNTSPRVPNDGHAFIRIRKRRRCNSGPCAVFSNIPCNRTIYITCLATQALYRDPMAGLDWFKQNQHQKREAEVLRRCPGLEPLGCNKRTEAVSASAHSIGSLWLEAVACWQYCLLLLARNSVALLVLISSIY